MQRVSQRHGLIAVDKQGNNIFFLNPDSFAIEQEINGLPPRPHELLILPDQGKAWVSVFGDGVHGDNPYPGHKIAVIDLRQRTLSNFIDISPLKAPHTARIGHDGKVYICCEDSSAIAILDPLEECVTGKIAIPSHNAHRLTLLPGGRKLFTDNEEDATITVVDLCQSPGEVVDTILMPGPLAGIDASPQYPYLVASDATRPVIYEIDANSHRVRHTLPLDGHHRPAQVVRFSADGTLLAVIGDNEPLVSLFDALLTPLATIKVGERPMDGCFSPDNSRLLIANEGDGTLSVIELATRKVVATPRVGRGCEILSYFSVD
ncbi:hypothetical protein BTJ39_01765 [Izhakiella australiensis]|uniref:Surface layer protein n=2 Tax=Izhakiella australiensis TaxID=1926881 RepID=A0A1S8YTR1_9GAMM|nr:hypothetical protein [Izhakiella australiensis]OON42212.1 hypothetical protein BTJ39_01765 [Izhakiella australiensis]